VRRFLRLVMPRRRRLTTRLADRPSWDQGTRQLPQYVLEEIAYRTRPVEVARAMPPADPWLATSTTQVLPTLHAVFAGAAT
jgi:hypothetical protein